jgi:hypothetical protein
LRKRWTVEIFVIDPACYVFGLIFDDRKANHCQIKIFGYQEQSSALKVGSQVSPQTCENFGFDLLKLRHEGFYLAKQLPSQG